MLPLLKIRYSCTLALVLGASLSLISPAHADSTIYKWVDKDGVVSYSQNPPTDKNASNVTSFTVESLPPSQQKAANRMLANMDKQADAEFMARKKRLKEADQKIGVALQRLQDAERRLSAGSTPTGSDRVGNVGGHARLRDSYFTRVENLQDQVDQAQQTLNDAYATRDKL